MRYNQSTETLNGYSIDTDIGDFGNGFNAPTTLSGDHTFSHVNPAFGFTVTPTDTLTFYADYNEASRAPTVIELGCANPQAPCGLPNDFASDPDLKQVVARTFEVGARGNLADQRLNWSADVFHTVNQNDIQFVATATNAGYFDNVGNTRRQGLDLSLGGKEGPLKWHVAYSYVDATFQSTFEVNAESNSTADANGNILVQPGDRIPLIPKHTGRLILDYEITPQWDVGRQRDRNLRLVLARQREQRQSTGRNERRGSLCRRKRLDSRLRGGQSAEHVPRLEASRALCAPREPLRQALRDRGIPHQQLIQSQRLAHRQPQQLAERECRLTRRAAGGLGRYSRTFRVNDGHPNQRGLTVHLPQGNQGIIDMRLRGLFSAARRLCGGFYSIVLLQSAFATTPSEDTRTPIKHLVVIIGENRTFDHVFATYRPAPGERVWNLLSQGIVTDDGAPGPNFAQAEQQTAPDPSTDAFLLGAAKKPFPDHRLPPPLVGGPKESYIAGNSMQLAKESENGLPDDYYRYLVSGGTGLAPKTADIRIDHAQSLPAGPFQLTNGKTLTYDDYAASPAHRFYQMWQQLDCNVDHATAERPSGCDAQLVAWVAVTVGHGSNGRQPRGEFQHELCAGRDDHRRGLRSPRLLQRPTRRCAVFQGPRRSIRDERQLSPGRQRRHGRESHRARPWRSHLVQRRRRATRSRLLTT